MKKSAFHGSWSITKTEVWDKAALDLEKPAFILFEDNRMGEFHLLLVHGWIDCRYEERAASLRLSSPGRVSTKEISAAAGDGPFLKKIDLPGGCFFMRAMIRDSQRKDRKKERPQSAERHNC